MLPRGVTSGSVTTLPPTGADEGKVSQLRSLAGAP